MSGRFTLSWLEYDILWEHLGLGRRPPILDINSHGRTFDERAELRTSAWNSLARKGAGAPGDLHPDLEFGLRLLARPEWELDGRLHLSADGPRTSVLIGARKTAAAVGVLDAERFTVWRTAASGIARTAVAQLPACPPGTGLSITLPADTLDACAARAGNDPGTLQRALVSSGLGKDEARKLVGVVGQVVRFGHLGAAHTPRHGARQRAGHVVSFYDNPLGRYLLTRRDSWVTLAPGSPPAITRQVEELLDSLTRTRR
ncbi:ESX secretion-associated protein EspG [Actinophytocola glycyrrhizae]|uniref:ESX secretion-associated protein EspG n=1 Tax=Actinophytocola glycyrrhizae TaxID=2044873 RepID=A0ABV9S4T1_9PSEU